MKLYTAFDLHSNNSYLGIIDKNGKRVYKRKLANETLLILSVAIRVYPWLICVLCSRGSCP